MSWWVGVDLDGDGDEPVDDDHRNVTYNVSKLLRLVLPHKDGLWGYAGAPASEAGGIFAKAAVELAALPTEVVAPLEPSNGWGSRTSAVEDLRWLAEACASAPKGNVYVH